MTEAAKHAQMRAEFERYFSDNGATPAAIERSGEGYRLMQAQASWVTWQFCWNRRATPAPAQPEGQEDEPVAWQGRTIFPEPAGLGWSKWRQIAEADMEAWRRRVTMHPDVYQQRALYLRPSRAAAPAEGAAWQPIETAPKDGQFVLTTMMDSFGPVVLIWSHKKGQWADGYSDEKWTPTHWMPLPATTKEKP